MNIPELSIHRVKGIDWLPMCHFDAVPGGNGQFVTRRLQIRYDNGSTDSELSRVNLLLFADTAFQLMTEEEQHKLIHEPVLAQEPTVEPDF